MIVSMSQTLSGQQTWTEMDWKALELPMQSPGIEHAIKFRQAKSSHDIVVEGLIQIEEDQCLLMGSDGEYPASTSCKKVFNLASQNGPAFGSQMHLGVYLVCLDGGKTRP